VGTGGVKLKWRVFESVSWTVVYRTLAIRAMTLLGTIGEKEVRIFK
jgi:hypothetical protein